MAVSVSTDAKSCHFMKIRSKFHVQIRSEETRSEMSLDKYAIC